MCFFHNKQVTKCIRYLSGRNDVAVEPKYQIDKRFNQDCIKYLIETVV